MNDLWPTIGTHLAVTTLLGMVIYGVTRWYRNPHVACVLWTLVLAKMLVPPLLYVELPSWMNLESTSQTVATAPPEHGSVEIPTTLPSGSMISLIETAPAGPLETLTTEVASPVASLPPTVTSKPAVKPDPVSAAALVLSAWAIASIGYLVLTTSQCVRFQRTISNMLPSPSAIQDQSDAVADRLGLRQWPQVRQTSMNVCPFVWSFWRPTIVVPIHLIESLEIEQLRSILAHEMAHLRRRDHWLGLLQWAATTVHWWNPIVWLARCELRQQQDTCCDAMVAKLFPDSHKAYAETLFSTICLTTPSPGTPALANSFGAKRFVSRRIEMILQNRWPEQLSRLAAVSLAVICVSTLLLSAKLGTLQERVKAASRTAETSALEEVAKVGPAPAAPVSDDAIIANVVGAPGPRPMALDFTSDGKFLVGACMDRGVRIWDPRNGTLLHVLVGHTSQPVAIVVTPDDKWAISVAGNGEVFTWEIATGTPLSKRHLQGDSENLAWDHWPRPCFAQSATRLLTKSSKSGRVTIWDVPSGKPLHVFDFDDRVYSAAIRPDGKRIAVLTAPHREGGGIANVSLQVANVDNKSIDIDVPLEQTPVPIEFFPDGIRLATSISKGILVINTNDGTIDNILPARLRQTYRIAFSKDKRWMALGGAGMRTKERFDGALHYRAASETLVWNLNANGRAFEAAGPNGEIVWALAVSDNGKYLARADGKTLFIQDCDVSDNWHSISYMPEAEHVFSGQTTVPITIQEKTLHGRGQKQFAEELVHNFAASTISPTGHWLATLREIKKIGEPAVEPLIAELDRTTNTAKLRLLGFALRTMDDPRAVPALLRAIPKSLIETHSDLGLLVDDEQLLRFAQEHDLDRRRDGFGLGRPEREICGALSSITGEKLGDGYLMCLEGSIEQYAGNRQDNQRRRDANRKVLRQYTVKWQQWYEAQKSTDGDGE